MACTWTSDNAAPGLREKLALSCHNLSIKFIIAAPAVVAQALTAEDYDRALVYAAASGAPVDRATVAKAAGALRSAPEEEVPATADA